MEAADQFNMHFGLRNSLPSSSGFRAIILVWFRDNLWLHRYSLLSLHLFCNSGKGLVMYKLWHEAEQSFPPVSFLAYTLTVKMKETHSAEMTTDFQWTTLHYIPEFCRTTTARISNPIIRKSRYIFSLKRHCAASLCKCILCEIRHYLDKLWTWQVYIWKHRLFHL